MPGLGMDTPSLCYVPLAKERHEVSPDARAGGRGKTDFSSLDRLKKPHSKRYTQSGDLSH